MPDKIRFLLIVIAVGLTAFTLWPVYAVGTSPLIPVLIVFLAVGAWLTTCAYRRRSHWPRFGLIGGVPGTLIGGIAFVQIARAIGRQDDDGIESMVVLSAGIGGAYLGALAGAAAGAIVGLLIDRSTRS